MLRSMMKGYKSQTQTHYLNVRNIAVDFDDVIVPFMSYFIKFCSRHLKRPIVYENTKTLLINELLECDAKETHSIFTEFYGNSEEWLELHKTPPIVDCVNVLTTLKKEGYGFYIVTARSHEFDNITNEYLNTFLPGIFDGVHFANYYGIEGKKTTKLALCIESDCQVLIDDSPQNVYDLHESQVDGILFGNYPWNNDFEHHIKVHQWEDLLNLLMGQNVINK